MKKHLPYALAIATLLIGFYGGLKYQQSKMPAGRTPQAFGQGGNRRNGGGNGFINGQIISQDDKSLTIKMNDNSTKIVWFSDSTNIGKTVAGAKTDLAVGQEITVTGPAQSDGSVTAQMIQIRPSK